MIKIENTEVFGWGAAIRGMRNPMNSWHLGDTDWFNVSDDRAVESDYWLDSTNDEALVLGDNDLDLMKRLRNAGTDHRKYLRMIHVQADVIAPLYWWKEYDTYKVSTVANSCSTMHKIHVKEFELSDFSIEHLNDDVIKKPFKQIIDCLNFFRELYLQNKDKDDWWQMIQLLPTSYNQKRTVDLNYENLINMYHARKNHKLDEWREFCEWIETLPYSELIIGDKKEGE